MAAAACRRAASAELVRTAAVSPVCSTTAVQRTFTRHFGVAYSKALKKKRSESRVFHPTWTSYNEPRLTAKFLRYADRVGRELGVTAEAAAFDEAAKRFPVQPPLVASTLVERNNVIIRDLEDWEADFIEFKQARADALAKVYPKELYEIWDAEYAERELAARGRSPQGDAAGKDGKKKGGKGKDAAAAPKAEAGGDKPKEAAAAAGDAAEGSGSSGGKKSGRASSASETLDSFYDSNVASGPAVEGGSGSGDLLSKLNLAPRVSSADEIGDLRSLDRAYTQRLMLLLQDKKSGVWFPPAGERHEGEPMVQAAERVLRGLWGPDPSLDIWFIGNSPVGHMLQVYSPQKQEETRCYGRKIFFYRAELMNGRYRLPKAAGEAGRDPAAFDVGDFQWLARDETESVLERPTFKYLHQIIGAGPGEEFERRGRWMQKLEAAGKTPAQATAERAARVYRARVDGLRMPAVVTAEQAVLAAAPYPRKAAVAATDAAAAGGEKLSALKAQVNAYHDRVREQKAITASLRVELNTPSARALSDARMAARRAAIEAAAATAAQ